MNIPIIHRTEGEKPDGTISEGPKAGTFRFYRNALTNTLIHLKPKHCLEIGTYYGQSSMIFHRYFERYESTGRLVTCDIKRYNPQLDHTYITQVQVYPHTINVEFLHKVRESDLLANALEREYLDRSVENNAALLRQSDSLYDFCFLDGDHQKESFLKDMEIALLLTAPPHYILVDDTEDYSHDTATVFHEMKKNFNCYEFEDYPQLVGMGLLWSKVCE